jgi:hypothetical protein
MLDFEDIEDDCYCRERHHRRDDRAGWTPPHYDGKGYSGDGSQGDDPRRFDADSGVLLRRLNSVSAGGRCAFGVTSFGELVVVTLLMRSGGRNV